MDFLISCRCLNEAGKNNRSMSTDMQVDIHLFNLGYNSKRSAASLALDQTSPVSEVSQPAEAAVIGARGAEPGSRHMIADHATTKSELCIVWIAE